MRVRVVVYAPDALTRRVADRIAARFSARRSEVRCDRYNGVLGPLRRGTINPAATCPTSRSIPPSARPMR
jgi:hypothetical protein